MSAPARKPFPAFVAADSARQKPADLIALNRHVVARDRQSKAAEASCVKAERPSFAEYQAGFCSVGSVG